MKASAIVAVLLVPLAVAPVASAKSCVRIEAAAAAAVGEPVRVTVRNYVSQVVAGQVVPGAPAPFLSPRLELTAQRPDGRQLKLRTYLVGDTRVARITFGRPGVWRVWATNWTWAPRSCAPPVLVRVRAPA